MINAAKFIGIMLVYLALALLFIGVVGCEVSKTFISYDECKRASFNEAFCLRYYNLN